MKTLLQSIFPVLLMQVLLLLNCSNVTYGQCTNSTQYPSSTSFAINPGGATTNISTCNFAGEYSVLTGALAGQTLLLNYSLPGGFITVRSGSPAGPVLASGNAPLSYLNSFTGDLYVHWNSSAACGSNTTCSTTSVQCSSCSGGGCLNSTQYPTGTYAINPSGGSTSISSCNFSGEYSVVTGAVSGQMLTFSYSQAGGYITVRSGTSGGAVVATGLSPLSFANTYTGTLYAHWNTSIACGSNTSCGNTAVQCTNCFPPPPCNSPGTPVISNITTTSATVNFAAAGGGLTYDWTVGTGGSCPTGTGANTASTMLSLSGLIPNTTYRVCVRTSTCGGGVASGYVTSTFTTEPLPNDNCSGAATVTCSGTVNGTTVGATFDGALGSCGIGSGGTPGNGVWYKLVGNGAQVTLNLCASAYDTKVHVYSGTCGSLSCVVSNDDNVAACGGGSTRSQAIFNANVGTDYYILVNGSGSTTGTFSMNISCLCGPALGAPWTTTNIGSSNGGAIENVCDNTIDVSATNYGSPTNDIQSYAWQQMCGNGFIKAKVENVTNGGWGGIMFRENNAGGSKKIALRTQLTSTVVRDLRAATNGVMNQQQFPRPNTPQWLRLTRTGNVFVGETSLDGVNWDFTFTATLVLPSCIEVGLFAQSINASTTTTAIFSNLMGVPLTPPVIPLAGGNTTTINDVEHDFIVYPNPAQSEINVKMGNEFIGKNVTIRVSNQLGQTVMTHRITNVESLIERLPLNNLTGGFYVLTLQTGGQELISKKFVVSPNRP
jgi:hypothetical protein